MVTTPGEIESSGMVRIAGQDEARAADVVPGNDGKNRLAVDATGLHSASKKFRLVWSATNLLLTASYQSVYSYSGVGQLFGYSLDADSYQGIEYKLIVDGETVFEGISGDFVRAMFGNPSPGLAFLVVGESTLNQFDFRPPVPIAFFQSVVIQARRVSGTKHILRYLVAISKEA